MPTRIYEVTFTVPAGTPSTAPRSQKWVTEDNLINDVELEIPSGHNGVTGVRLMKGDTQLIPWGNNSWIIATDYTHTFPVGAYLPTGDLIIQGYNTGVNAHSFYLRISVSDWNANPTAGQGSPSQALPTDVIQSPPDPLSPDALLGPDTAAALASGTLTAADLAPVDTVDLTVPPVPAPVGL